MAYFIWFDNDNLDYGGIGVVEYGNRVARIVSRKPAHPRAETARNENHPPTPTAGAEAAGSECDR